MTRRRAGTAPILYADNGCDSEKPWNITQSWKTANRSPEILLLLLLLPLELILNYWSSNRAEIMCVMEAFTQAYTTRNSDSAQKFQYSLSTLSEIGNFVLSHSSFLLCNLLISCENIRYSSKKKTKRQPFN